VPSTCEVKGQGTSDVTGTNDSDCRHSAQVPAARQLWTRLEMSCTNSEVEQRWMLSVVWITLL